MNLLAFLPFVAAAFSFALAVFVILQDRHSFVHRIFAAGMLILTLEAVFSGVSLQGDLPAEVLHWHRLRLIMTAFLPGVWLLFSLIYARANYKEILSRWRWIIISAFVVPLAISPFFRETFFVGEPLWDSPLVWLIRLGRPGYAFHLCLLVSAVLILMNLERTLRVSTGHMRWQIKYMVLGIGSIFGIRIYTSSQIILYHHLDTHLLIINSGVLILASALIFRSLLRSRLFNLDFYLSHSILYNSITVLIVGAYLLTVGVLAKLVEYLNGGTSLYLNAFLIFLGLLGLSVILLSDRLRHKIRRFIAIHFRRPQFDYQKEWRKFTEKTSTITGVEDLCMTVSRMISDILEVLSVTLWLLDESHSRLRPIGSTVFTETGKGHRISEEAERKLLEAIRNQEIPVDLDDPDISWAQNLKQLMPDSIQEARVRYCMPLSAGENLLGVMTLGEKVEYKPLSFEEMDLLKTIADQAAGSLLNLKLAEDLRKVREMEAFQTMSAFMIHDLKNLASSLSLTMQNMAVHFDHPDFRKDVLRIMEQGVTKTNDLCGHLSMLSQKIELKRKETDLNELVDASIFSMNGSPKISVQQNLEPLPHLMIDPEQIQKVLTNLILNAYEAMDREGEIQVRTAQKDGWTILSVSDNGCGMSKEFIEKSLFRPFKTTKKQGMGIGLYQSKMIVEAHQGRIEVESEEGKGSVFRVMLPMKRE
jgi:putative PEP-CTERM system histidine kinase